MSRIKLKYSKSEIDNNLYTFGEEWMTIDTQEYKGLYHQYTLTEETYTGGTWNESTSKLLLPITKESESIKTYNDVKNQIKESYDAIIPIQITITSADTNRGYINRYFLKKINESIYIEISSDQFDSYESSLDTNLYIAGVCTWYITGPIETVTNPVLVPGVFDLNTTEINKLQKTLPGISQKLNNPLQFYTDTDFVVPRDINLG